MNFDKAILATTFLLFIVMLIVTAKLNQKLAYQIYELSKQKEHLINELKVLSITDPLTGLYNRRRFEMVFKDECNRARRNKYPVNIVSIDIDNFKLVNDTFGHPYGDKLLICTAELLNASVRRSNDKVFRFGGDEFGAIIVNMTLPDVITLCTKIQKKFKSIRPPNEANAADVRAVFDKVTLSMGVAHIPYNSIPEMDNIEVTLDNALYQAKRAGKNKIVSVEFS